VPVTGGTGGRGRAGARRGPTVPEGGLSPSEVGKEIAQHRSHAEVGEATGRDRTVSIIEAVLLAVVAVLAAWSGYSSAKWGTESRLKLAQASAARVEAASETQQADLNRNFDASTFNAWFTAKVAGNQIEMTVAERRFRPEFRVAFDAWIATDPDTNPHAPPGPTYMSQYVQPELAKAEALNKKADGLTEEGVADGNRSDDYVRTTVYLATVLFLVGISGHFRVTAARYGLVGVGIVILAFAIWQLAILPLPPA